jgi:hypothetical protein
MTRPLVWTLTVLGLVSIPASAWPQTAEVQCIITQAETEEGADKAATAPSATSSTGEVISTPTPTPDAASTAETPAAPASSADAENTTTILVKPGTSVTVTAETGDSSGVASGGATPGVTIVSGSGEGCSVTIAPPG